MLCLLYVLSTASESVVSDLLATTLRVRVVSDNSIRRNTVLYQFCRCISIHLLHYLLNFKLTRQTMPVILIANGCCDFIAQWIILVRINHFTHPFYSLKSSTWGRSTVVGSCASGVQNIRVVIIPPSFLAITYLGQSFYLHFDKPTLNYRVY